MTAQSNSDIGSIVARVERMEDEKKALGEDIRDLYKEAKSRGHDPKAIRAVVKRRRETAEDRTRREQLENDIELILSAVETAAIHQHGEEIGR